MDWHEYFDALVARVGLCTTSERELEYWRGRKDGVHIGIAEQRETIDKLQAQLDALRVPSDDLPFCVSCRGTLHRGDGPYRIISFQHTACPTKSTDATQSRTQGDLDLSHRPEVVPQDPPAAYDDLSDLELVSDLGADVAARWDEFELCNQNVPIMHRLGECPGKRGK